VFEEVFWEIFVHTELPYFEPCRIEFQIGPPGVETADSRVE